MLDPVFDWLERRRYRWPVANVILVTLMLTLIDSTDLMGFIGVLALGLLALAGAHGARRSMRGVHAGRHPFELLLLWFPGAFAFAMAAGGLWLATKTDLRLLGLVMFCGHAALLLFIAGDQEEGRTVLPGAAPGEPEAG